MEEILFNLGINENDLKIMKEIDPNLTELSEKEINEKIKILEKLGCDKEQIRSIISSNVMYLEEYNDDIEKLIKKLKEKGFSMLNILFEENPYILNLPDFEIERYIEKRERNGENLEDIVDDMESHSYIFLDI